MTTVLIVVVASDGHSSHTRPDDRGAMTIHVTADGRVDGTGTRDDPMTLDAAATAIREHLMSDGLPQGGFDVRVHGGRYQRFQPLILDQHFQGTSDDPISFSAQDGVHVVIDGGCRVRGDAFSSVEDSNARARLSERARDSVVFTTIVDDETHRALGSTIHGIIVIDGEAFQVATFPNDGYAFLDPSAVVEEVCPPGIPKSEQRYGVRAGTHPFREEGRPAGWRGSSVEPRGAWSGFSKDEPRMAGTWAQWQREIATVPHPVTLTGYIEAHWLLSSHDLVAADPDLRAVHLPRALSYGWAWRPDKPFRIAGLMCELDAPGEWYYDAPTRRLFVYPTEDWNESTEVTIPVAEGFLHLNNTAHVRFRGFHVTNLRGGVGFHLNGGSHNLISGGSVHSCNATGVVLDGTFNTAAGLDLIDLDRHVQLRGRQRGPDIIEPGSNTVENCHITQSRFRHRRISW